MSTIGDDTYATARGPVDLDALASLERLREVAAYNLFDAQMRDELNTICQRTAQRLGQPIGLVTIVLDSAQLVIGKSGLAGWIAASEGTPAEWAFCARAVLAGKPYVVPDATTDEQQRHNPLVVHDHVAAYAGVPLRSPSGQMLGAHCVLNDHPQEFTPEQVAELEQAGAEIVAVLDRYKRAA
jgi:GAF domain-containing protein